METWQAIGNHMSAHFSPVITKWLETYTVLNAEPKTALGAAQFVETQKARLVEFGEQVGRTVKAQPQAQIKKAAVKFEKYTVGVIDDIGNTMTQLGALQRQSVGNISNEVSAFKVTAKQALGYLLEGFKKGAGIAIIIAAFVMIGWKANQNDTQKMS
jgi:hypothetical protein